MVLGSFIAATIDIIGNIYFKNIDNKDYDEDKLDKYMDKKGRGEYELLQTNIVEEEEKETKYKLFGYCNGEKKVLNKSECIEEFKTYGDIMIVEVNEDEEPVDIKKDMLFEFIPHNLEDFSDTESHLGEDNDYDYTDGFIVCDIEQEMEEIANEIEQEES